MYKNTAKFNSKLQNLNAPSNISSGLLQMCLLHPTPSQASTYML